MEEELESYPVMEYVAGTPLAEYVADGARLDDALVVDLATQLASGLSAAHKLNVVHRDLKPENVLLLPREDGRRLVKILDFGIAKVLEDSLLTGLTSSGVALGTPAYVAPEQLPGRIDRIGPTTDLYALGVIMYRLLTGRLPYWGDTIERMAAGLAREEVLPLTYSRPDLRGSTINGLVEALLEVEPERRPGSAVEVVRALSG